MPLHDTDAFVLRTFTLKEADKICVFLTREAGKLRGVAKGARRLRSKFGASLEPFTEVQLTYFLNENRELVSLSNCEIVQSHFAAGISSERLGVLHYLAELLIEFIPDHEPNEKIYRLVGASVEVLKTAQDAQLATLTRYFEVWLLKLGGFLADTRRCGMCQTVFRADEALWLNKDGAPRCYDCSGGAGDQMLPTARRLLAEILAQSPAKFLATARDAATLAQISAITNRLISRVLERDLKSYELLDRLRPAEIGIRD